MTRVFSLPLHQHPVKFNFQKRVGNPPFGIHRIHIGMAYRIQKIVAPEAEKIRQQSLIVCLSGKRHGLFKKSGRALIVQPQVLFMDEPFSALDALLRARMQDFLTALRRRHPCSVILVTHDISEAVALGSHVLMLAPHGRRAPECFENPAYSQELGCGDRASPAFYDTVRRIHAGLAAASGEDE